MTDPCGCACHRADEEARERCDGTCGQADYPCVYGCIWADTLHQREARIGRTCRRCYWRARYRLLELIGAHGWAGQQMLGLGSGWKEPVSGTADTDPAWFDLHDLRDLIAWRVWWYADNLAEDRQACLVAHHDRIDVTARYLLANLHHVAAGPWFVDMEEEVTDTLRDVHAAIPWRPEVRRMPVPCDECDLLTLVWRGGENFIACTNPECDRIIPYWRYERYVRRLDRRHNRKAA